VNDTVVLARAQWPADDADTELPAVAGFIESAFSPLVAAVAERCLASYFGDPPTALARGERTAIALATSTGDLTTAAAVAAAAQAGRRVPPLLFYQSNPNAVAGYVAARWGLAGPIVCTMPGSAAGEHRRGDLTSRALAEAHACAALLIEDGDADAALVIAANAYLGGAAVGTAELVGPSWWSSA
jgi:3-oxoacyl-(acyl-carrier-protein) synthase